MPRPKNIRWAVPVAGTRLVDMNGDALGEVYKRVLVPFALKLTCRALRDVGPKQTKTGCKRLVNSGVGVLQWACDLGYSPTVSAANTAALTGRLPELQLLRAKECPWDWMTCAMAAMGGHLTLLQWAIANGCPLDNNESMIVEMATLKGELQVVQWAISNNYPWDKGTCVSAAIGGHLGVLQWLRANGCPWDAATCSAAAMNGHLAVLQWARANGCRWNARARRCGVQGPPRDTEVAPRQRVPVGQGDVLARGEVRPPRGAAVGARQRVPVGPGQAHRGGKGRKGPGVDSRAARLGGVGRTVTVGRWVGG